MNITYQNGKDQNVEKKYQGCLGKMVNLFELNLGVPANKRITDKPHQDGFTSSRRISADGDRVEEKTTLSDPRDPSQDRKRSHVTPVKMLMDQEMSKELRSKRSPPNLVAKLMGLDSLPQEDTDRIAQRVHARSRSVIPVSDYEQDNGFFEYANDPDVYRNVHEVSKQSRGFVRTVNDEKMALVRRKFAEAKRLSADEKHRDSKKLHDALDVLNSNKDLFLRCLQEPNPLFCNSQDDSRSVIIPPPAETKRITILRPSKLAEDDKNGKKNNNGVANSSQPTRIVVLKPKSHIDDNTVDSLQVDSLEILSEECSVDTEDDESHEVREVAKAVTVQMREKLGRHHRDETMDSLVFSKGYVGDDSSFTKSEFECSIGNFGDLEAASPVSRHSWDCINRQGSPYSPSALSRASYSSESSVSREAKKRLSERWALMSSATNENPHELRRFQRSSSTLGEMLSLSEVKKSATKSEGKRVTEEHNDSNPVSVNGLRVDENDDSSPRNFIRSKSLPVSSAPKEETKPTSSKSSLRVKVSNLLFARNKKPGKDKSLGSITSDEIQPPVSGEVGSDITREKLPSHASSSLQDSSPVVSLSDHVGKKDMVCSEACFSTSKPITPQNAGDNQDQPSPVSVLNAPFEEDDHAPKLFPRCELPDKYGFSLPLNPISSKSIDKSPPIGSIPRTLSWDDLITDTSSLSCPVKDSATTIQESEEEKREWIVYVETLLTGLRGQARLDPYSPNRPMDPSIRDKYLTIKDNETLTEAKRRQKRSIQKLVFDYVNASLIDAADQRLAIPCIEGDLFDELRSRINAWFSGETVSLSGNFGDECIMVVERVVKEEVSGKGWADELRRETSNLGREIEGKLLEELVHESVLEITG